VKVARERGITTPWHKLSFNERYCIIQEIEATLSKPRPLRPPIREFNGGASEGIGGGIGLPLGVKKLETPAAPSGEGWRDHIVDPDDPMGLKDGAGGQFSNRH
jgi:hypothetical protein